MVDERDDEEQDPNMEELFSQAANEELEEQIKKDLLIQPGTWTTMPPLRRTLAKADEKSKFPGRPVARYFTQLQRVNKDTGMVEKASINFRISHEGRKKAEDGKWDLATRLYLDAKNVFLKSGGTFGTSMDVYDFLRDYPVNVRVSLLEGNEQYPEPSNLVLRISKVRDEA